MASRPILAVQVWWEWLTVALRIKASNSAPLCGPGRISRFAKRRSDAELPIARQTSTQILTDFRSAGSSRAFASISIGSLGSEPMRRSRPRLAVRNTAVVSDQLFGGGGTLDACGLAYGASTMKDCRSG